ncbi:helix-turn-helix transcriptional regulator [Paenibacillus sp. 481]|uniref:helix-turn-helix transcriptional regulator n=1 Tax=Paenibacillus sp. 481 TaxID=2835869 RepID=UPI001E5EA1A8|nr:helix-turn-helix transcriptional regulator [Paenibacillus sp. 481]UHA71773.1 helix-turn-helix transcriptional regulator [Paenibacillus sp. 481]
MIQPRKWLIHLRGAKTQKEVATMSDINRSSYSNIERGRRDPSVQVAMRIGEALGFSWYQFFERGDSIACDEVKATPTVNRRSH